VRHAYARLVVRTGLSESGAFEVAYNLFKGKNVPMFFAIWRQSPIKTTLLRELHDLGTVVYVDFEHPEELQKPLRNFLSLVAHSCGSRTPDSVEVLDTCSIRDQLGVGRGDPLGDPPIGISSALLSRPGYQESREMPIAPSPLAPPSPPRPPPV